ncbi:addiction module antidote protein [Methylobacterium sp. NFXW15]|uniref:addiction module antidote protein n=1 Tax=Methylobacterium sp. NFXW15 TaxID=2819512 RepID=UPI003CFB4682
MPLKTAPYDSADYLKTPEDIAFYLEAALEENDPALLAHALGVIARAQGMADIAERTGRSREQLYRTLSDRGNPQLDTLMSVLSAMGLRLSIQPVEEQPQAA